MHRRKRQCLEHWSSFQHEIAAAPIVCFCTSSYYASISQAGIAAQTLPVTLSLMQHSEEKEIKITQRDCAQSQDKPSAFSTN